MSIIDNFAPFIGYNSQSTKGLKITKIHSSQYYQGELNLTNYVTAAGITPNKNDCIIAIWVDGEMSYKHLPGSIYTGTYWYSAPYKDSMIYHDYPFIYIKQGTLTSVFEFYYIQYSS